MDVIDRKNVSSLYHKISYAIKEKAGGQKGSDRTIRSYILFKTLENCLINTENKNKVEFFPFKNQKDGIEDSPDRRTDLFAYYLFFGEITISDTEFRSQNFRDIISLDIKQRYGSNIANLKKLYDEIMEKYKHIFEAEHADPNLEGINDISKDYF